MKPIRITKGAAPRHLLIAYQDGSVVDLSGGGKTATLKGELVDNTATTFSLTGTGLNSSGYCYVTFTTTITATAGEYVADLVVTGLTAGTFHSEEPIKVIIRDSKGA
jgi:hypothetical protein